jgi:hypothetical protein
MTRPLRLTLLAAVLAALLLAPGCTPRRTAESGPATPEAAWKVFRRNYCVPRKEPGLLVKASLYYTRVKPTKRTNRTLVTLWGDFGGAMRLDIAAGMGKLLAHIREDDTGLLVFYPTEKKAYAHVNAVLGATRLGMPFPFSLNELARVTAGDFSGLIPKLPKEGARTNGGFSYLLDGGLVTVLELDGDGRPIILEGRTTKAYETAREWRLEINSYEDPAERAAPLPRRLTLALDNGEQGVLRIRSRALKMAPWPAKALEMALPPGVMFQRLDNGAKPAGETKIPVVYEDKS